MSKTTDFLVVGALSTALFTGFTAYSYSVDQAKAKAQAKLPTPVAVTAQIPQNPSTQQASQAKTIAPATTSSKSSTIQTPVNVPAEVAPPPANTTVTKTKTTKSKAS